MITTTPGGHVRLADWKTLCAFPLSNAAGLRIDLLENGAIGAVRHHDTLINQVLGAPPEGAPFRLFLRPKSGKAVSLLNPSRVDRFAAIDHLGAAWHGSDNRFAWSTMLALEENTATWTWQIHITNRDSSPHTIDVIMAQDVGLARLPGVRLNENYNAHYVDYTILDHAAWGPVICVRQNLAQEGNRHPWLAVGCTSGASQFATDGLDVFGLEQRVLGRPRVLCGHDLPSVRRQGESACAALQSRETVIAPGESVTIRFLLFYLEHHPHATGAADLTTLVAPPVKAIPDIGQPVPRSIFDEPAILNGEDFSDDVWNKLFPDRRNEERRNGILWSFFTGENTHVVTKAKESSVERMHGHILLGSSHLLPRPNDLGATVYAPGIFNAQTYAGNPSICRLLTFIRDPIQRLRSSGQRIWVQLDDAWHLLGTPSAFAMAHDHATWLYQTSFDIIEITSRAHAQPSSITLTCRTRNGTPLTWRITHQLALDANEFDSSGIVECLAESASIRLRPDPESQEGLRHPGRAYLISCLPMNCWSHIGHDERNWLDETIHASPHVVLETLKTEAWEIRIELESNSNERKPVADDSGIMPALSWSISKGTPSMMQLAEILPWYHHDAWIHLASPHGLEQYGGGAWGVRDVCQGPMEWLLTEQRYVEAREILRIVFSHQYRNSGLWPQWFMLNPFSDIQQKHCHGDVMFWPIKALCDYAEAANDPGILDLRVSFADDNNSSQTGAALPLIDHAWLVVAAYRTMCVGDTSLISYGEGDWDDTLQPARAEMRKGMVSSWTVQLAYQAFRQLSNLLNRAGHSTLSSNLSELCDEIRRDFYRNLMPDGIVAGFAVYRDYEFIPLLHPRDMESGINYRLLPMTRGIISEMFDRDQAVKHMNLVRTHLRFPDGVRLMNRPVAYRGGISHLFQRAETSAYFGREVSLNYVHAHLRYAEAMARMGDADELWWALGVVNPVLLDRRIEHAAPRQSNVYFSSSDGDFMDRHDAERHYDELRSGKRAVKAGWRLYSSGPGLFLHKIRNCLFGIREYYDRIIFDPVIPGEQLPCAISLRHEGKPVTVLIEQSEQPGMWINDRPAPLMEQDECARGYNIDRAAYVSRLDSDANTVRIALPAPKVAP